MAQAQLAVSWDDFQKNVCKGLSFMQEQGEFVDMTLAADGHYVKVHKMVLSLISPYIKDLITSVDCAHPVIFLNNISYPTLCSILEYVYTGEVMIQKEGLKELIQAGKALHIKGLVDMALTIACEETIPDENEDMTTEVLNTDILDNDEVELNTEEDTTVKGDSNSDTGIYVKLSENNGRIMNDEISFELLKNVRLKTADVKRKLPVTGTTAVQYTMSNQGGLQMILNRYIYNMRYMSKNSSRRRWRCINYPRKMKCPAYVTTENDQVVERGCSHNHVFHDKLIMKKFRAGITFCALKDAELQVEFKKNTKTVSDGEKEDFV